MSGYAFLRMERWSEIQMKTVAPMSLFSILSILGGCTKPVAPPTSLDMNKAQPLSQTVAPAQQPATLSQQKMCSEQAEKSFKDSNFSNDKSSMGNTYTNHFDAVASICYVEVTTRHMGSGNNFQYYNLIFDAFEGRVYGSFMSFSHDVRPQECSIKPRGQPEIICKSGDEFNDLALKYFGTVPD
jgi:hypothetical protein